MDFWERLDHWNLRIYKEYSTYIKYVSWEGEKLIHLDGLWTSYQASLGKIFLEETSLELSVQRNFIWRMAAEGKTHEVFYSFIPAERLSWGVVGGLRESFKSSLASLTVMLEARAVLMLHVVLLEAFTPSDLLLSEAWNKEELWDRMAVLAKIVKDHPSI